MPLLLLEAVVPPPSGSQTVAGVGVGVAGTGVGVAGTGVGVTTGFGVGVGGVSIGVGVTVSLGVASGKTAGGLTGAVAVSDAAILLIEKFCSQPVSRSDDRTGTSMKTFLE